MRVDLLRAGVRVLREVAERQLPFDMRRWFETSEPEDCGTAACAAGWMARDPEFRAAGLRIVEVKDQLRLGRSAFFVPALGDDGQEVSRGLGAMAELLEVSEVEACWLFDGWQYGGELQRVGPLAVVRRLESLIESAG